MNNNGAQLPASAYQTARPTAQFLSALILRQLAS